MVGCTRPTEPCARLRDAYGAGHVSTATLEVRADGRARRPRRGRDLGPAAALVARPPPPVRGLVAGEREWPLGERGRWVLGRGSDCDLVLHGRRASRAGTPRSRSGRACAWSAISTRATGRCSTAAPVRRARSVAATCCVLGETEIRVRSVGDLEADRRRRERRRVERVARRRRVSIASVSSAPSAWLMLTVAGRPVSVAVPATTTLPVSFSASRLVGARRRSRGRPAPSPPAVIGSRGEADVDELGAGAAQVADRERVGAAAGDRVDLLEAGRAPVRRRRRVNRSPRPSASSANASASFVPWKNSESRLAPPSTSSLPSPGFQLKRSKSPPSHATSSPLPPLTSSKPLPPISVVVAGAAEQDVVAVAADERQRPSRRSRR